MKTLLALIATVALSLNLVAQESLYTAKEFQAGAGVGAVTPDFKHYTEEYHAELSYFISQKVGFRGRVAHVGFDVDNTFVSDSTLAVVFRIPIEQTHIAPYLLAGGGYSFLDRGWHADLGGGIEYRFTRLIGAFAEAAARPSFETGQNTWRFGGGVRFSF
jgi:hypothetical protein